MMRSEHRIMMQQRRDRARYLRTQEERKAYQRTYYAEHREIILKRKREKGNEKVVIH